MPEHPTPDRDGPPNEARRYCALIVGQGGHILKTFSFSAFGDTSAAVITKGLVDGHPVELWAGQRFIQRFEPHDS